MLFGNVWSGAFHVNLSAAAYTPVPAAAAHCVHINLLALLSGILEGLPEKFSRLGEGGTGGEGGQITLDTVLPRNNALLALH